MELCWECTIFTDLRKVFKILLILSHGQALVERGFSINKLLLVENLRPTSLVAQRIVNGHMVFRKKQPHEIDVTAKMVSPVRQARTRYLFDQRDRSLKKLQSEKDVKIQVPNDDMNDVNKKIKQLQDTMTSLKKTADEYSFEAEEKTKIKDVKSLILKSNALKRAVKEKEDKLESLIENKKRLKKEAL